MHTCYVTTLKNFILSVLFVACIMPDIEKGKGQYKTRGQRKDLIPYIMSFREAALLWRPQYAFLRRGRHFRLRERQSR